MTKKFQYKIIGSSNGFPELEEKVSKMLNEGWKPIGGVAFNQLHPYQAMAKLIEVEPEKKPNPQAATTNTPRAKTFNEALKDIDELT